MDATNVANQWFNSLIRLALAGVGGFFIRKGIVDSSLWETTLSIVVAGGTAAIWSLYHKYKVKEAVETALSLPKNSTPADVVNAVADKKENK